MPILETIGLEKRFGGIVAATTCRCRSRKARATL